MSRVVLKGFIIVPSEDLQAVEAELVNHQKLTGEEPGCLVFEVVKCKINPNRYDVYEEFVDKSAFEAHQLRVKNSRWGKVSANVERHYSSC